jgi:hypothetical protein
MNPTFTVHVIGPEAEKATGGAAWFPGEVQQYAELRALADGTKGTLVAKLPLAWSFRIEQPLAADWIGAERPDATPFAPHATADPRPWASVRSDLYLQAQGVRAASGDHELGYYAYETRLGLDAAQSQGSLRLMFPGLFNEAWLYVNGKLVAHRSYDEPWWHTDYRFEWDVDVSGRLMPGENTIRLIGFNPHHFAGMFRRPFLYRPSNTRSRPKA